MTTNVLDLVVEALPHLRGGLGYESAAFTARLLYENLELDACAVVDTERVLAYVGRGEDHHLVGGPSLTGLTHKAIATGQPYTARRREDIDCPVPGCPLTSVTIAPFVVRGAAVGALKLYRAGTPIHEADERVATGLARVFSVSLEAAELDARSALVTKAELDALRARVSPHFLFNTLTTIAALTRTDPARAHDLIVDFAEYFRDSLAQHHECVTLDDELEHVEQYVRFERARFGDRLAVEFAIDPRARLAAVPVMSVQPLVENAIVHGLAPKGGAGNGPRHRAPGERRYGDRSHRRRRRFRARDAREEQRHRPRQRGPAPAQAVRSGRRAARDDGTRRRDDGRVSRRRPRPVGRTVSC